MVSEPPELKSQYFCMEYEAAVSDVLVCAWASTDGVGATSQVNDTVCNVKLLLVMCSWLHEQAQMMSKPPHKLMTLYAL